MAAMLKNNIMLLTPITKWNTVSRFGHLSLYGAERCLCHLIRSYPSKYINQSLRRLNSGSYEPVVTNAANVEGSLIKRMLRSIGIGKYKYSKTRLLRSGYMLLMCIDDMVDFPTLTKRFQLPDTFYSNYLLTELHVWMLMCRLSQEGEEGRLVKKNLCAALWDNVEEKSKMMGEAASSSSSRKKSIASMGTHFNAALFAYDEGIVGDDKTLAGAVWRTIYHMDDKVNPHLLQTVTAYIRKQMRHLDQQDSGTLVLQGFIPFLSLDAEVLDKDEVNRKLTTRFKTKTT